MFSSQNSQVSNDANYIEDVFSTYLYTGNGSSSTRTITTGIDSSTYGSIVWIKNRTAGGTGRNNYLTTTALSNSYLLTNTTDAAVEQSVPYPVDPTSTGFNLNTSGSNVNTNGQDYASWTFRKQKKFFDVVTYTGNGVDGRAISHNLGAIPRFIIVKRTDASAEWRVYAYTPTGPQSFYLALNTTGADGQVTGGYVDNPTLTQFQTYAYSSDISTVNANGGTYVAYLFASNAGGFGLTGTDNVISCGSYTGNGTSLNSVTLGYEPQWLLVKSASTGGAGYNWVMIDNMRGFPVGSNDALLRANLSDAEVTSVDIASPTATGFNITTSDGGVNGSGQTYIYIAIRRGPMKVPTDGTKVFSPALGTSASTIPTFVTNFPVDLGFYHSRANTADWYLSSRLQGGGTLNTNTTFAEAAPDANYAFDSNTGWGKNFNSDKASSNFRRAPSFFDEVCYTGTGSATTVTHNLNVVPEMIIVKGRTNTFSWFVYQKDLTTANQSFLTLNTDSAVSTGSAVWNSTSPTSSVFSIGSANAINQSGQTYVAYLFATCAGVSKCFNYTGNGSSQTINCGFTGGARWILIKRTDSTGDWYCWDSARGIVSGNDPHLSLNTTAAEVTSDDTIDTDSTGFVVNQVSATNVNVSSATYIGIAIA